MTPKSNSPDRGSAALSSPPSSPAPSPSAPATATVAVWDLPLRLFHWALVFCVIGSFVTIKIGGSWMDWHMRFGQAILTLLLFRIVWGFIGGRHARFADFIVSPARLRAYLGGNPAMTQTLGHNPLGSLSVVAMIMLFLTQAVLGLFANDDIFTEGPLAHLISKEASDAITGWHKLGEYLLLALVGLHLLAIAFYRFVRGQRLVRAMIVGSKAVTPVRRDADAGLATASRPVDGTGLRITALLTLLACAGFVYWLVTAF